MSGQTPKYRPVLTASNISHILSLCKSDMTPESISVISILAPFEWKIKNGSVKPAHITEPAPSLSESCGLEIGKNHLPENHPYTKFHGQSLWGIYKSDPSLLSLSEINEALAYGYLNDLMTKEEEIAYQNSVIESAPSA